MVKQIVRDVFFLGQPSEPATKADIQVGKNSARNCLDGRRRSASMRLIICSEKLYNQSGLRGDGYAEKCIDRGEQYRKIHRVL